MTFFRKVKFRIGTFVNRTHNEFVYPTSSFCYDFTFWADKKCYNDIEPSNYTIFYQPTNYTIARYCSKAAGNETKKTCSEKSPLWRNEESYFCEKSKMCIPKSWTCDGSVHCVYADDEDFDLCQDTFPEGATFKCLQANTSSSYNITIYAVPCDGIMECEGRVVMDRVS